MATRELTPAQKRNRRRDKQRAERRKLLPTTNTNTHSVVIHASWHAERNGPPNDAQEPRSPTILGRGKMVLDDDSHVFRFMRLPEEEQHAVNALLNSGRGDEGQARCDQWHAAHPGHRAADHIESVIALMSGKTLEWVVDDV